MRWPYCVSRWCVKCYCTEKPTHYVTFHGWWTHIVWSRNAHKSYVGVGICGLASGSNSLKSRYETLSSCTSRCFSTWPHQSTAVIRWVACQFIGVGGLSSSGTGFAGMYKCVCICICIYCIICITNWPKFLSPRSTTNQKPDEAHSFVQIKMWMDSCMHTCYTMTTTASQAGTHNSVNDSLYVSP